MSGRVARRASGRAGGSDFLASLKRRALKATRRLEVKKAKQDLDKFKDDKYIFRDGVKQAAAARRGVYHNARADVRLGWEKAPSLVPHRHIGTKLKLLGEMPQGLLYPATVPERWRRKPWLAVGDRVAIMQGSDRGKIDLVAAVDEDAETVDLKTTCKALAASPEFFAKELQMEWRPMQIVARGVPWDNVRLVHRVVHDKVGEEVAERRREVNARRKAQGKALLKALEALTGKEVVVDEVELVEVEGEARPKRLVARLGEEIPWPKKEEADEEEYTDSTTDSARDMHTFEPTPLEASPMPKSVIDELRNKYSKTRKRHDPEWIAMKQEEIRLKAEVAAVRQGPSFTEWREKKQEDRPLKLSDAQLSAIGEVMASHRAATGKVKASHRAATGKVMASQRAAAGGASASRGL